MVTGTGFIASRCFAMGQRDAAIQFYTITNPGIDLKDISIVHINNQYTKNGERDNNIFSNKRQPLNQDYFKTLWGRFKRQSNLLEQDQTLYSFRHSGAIEIFKRTGSITKLQKAMGHSSINVSLAYLRGLEIAELKEEDMPMV